MESLKSNASEAESAKTSAMTAETPKSLPVEFGFRAEEGFSCTVSLVKVGSPPRWLSIAYPDVRMNHSKPNIGARTSDKYQVGFWYPSKIRFIPNPNSATAAVAAATTSE